MRYATSLLFAALLCLSGCRTAEPWICGTALFENLLAEDRAQVSPYVFCDKHEAELVLTVALRFPDSERRRPVSFYFRRKRATERLTLRERNEKVSKPGALWSRSTDHVAVVIRGDDLWVALVTEPATHSFTAAAIFAVDFEKSERGYVLEGRWTQTSNTAPEPSNSAGLHDALRSSRDVGVKRHDTELRILSARGIIFLAPDRRRFAGPKV